MATKRIMPDMFGAPPERPPRVERSGSKFSHYVPTTETDEPKPNVEVEDDKGSSPLEETRDSTSAIRYTTARREPNSLISSGAQEAPKYSSSQKRSVKMEPIATPIVESSEEEIWSVFIIPHIDLDIPVFDNVDALLEGPLVQTPLHILPAMEHAFRRLKASVRTSGGRVSFQTLYAHALAFAYTHADEWLYLAPSDGRREGSVSRLTSMNARITPELPAPLLEATHALTVKAGMISPKNAPALESVKTAALAWSLGRYGEWLDKAIANPVKAGERTTQHPLG